jgi:hypothetical protein
MALSRYSVVRVIIRQANICHRLVSTNQSGNKLDLQPEPPNSERVDSVISVSARGDRPAIETSRDCKEISPEKIISYKSLFILVKHLQQSIPYTAPGFVLSQIMKRNEKYHCYGFISYYLMLI